MRSSLALLALAFTLPTAVASDVPTEDSARETKHWAFQAPRRPAVPSTAGTIRNPIDAFVLTRLQRENLKPAPEADKLTLLRRLYLDLVGLPPTPAQIDDFVNDSSANAYEKLVDRLLASPHYGEKWARPWLDAARYADSDGFEKDKSRQVWFYRDYVIQAINRDLPYDRFLIEQLAGDLLPGATQDQRVATGYLRNSMINEEGGVDPEQFRMEAMFDRMDAIGKGMLGLTVQCCQCHDHKYDPFLQKDYYRLFAFLNNDHEANIAVYSPEELQKRAELTRQIAALEDDLRQRDPEWRTKMLAWEAKNRAPSTQWTVVRPKVDPESDGGQKYELLDDGSFLCQGYAPTKHTVRMEVKTDLHNIASFRIELLNDPNLPRGGPGRSTSGTATLTEFRVEAAPVNDAGKKQRVKFVKATADFNPPEEPLAAQYDDKSGKRRVTGPIAFAIDDKEETAWGTEAGPARRNQPRQAVFNTDKPIDHPQGTILTFLIAQNHGGWNSDDNQNHNIGRFRLSITSQAGVEADTVPPRIRALMAIAPEKRTPAQDAVIFSHYRTTVADYREANARIEALWQRFPEGTTQLILTPREMPRETHLLKRGDFLKPGKMVRPGVPDFLNPLPSDAGNDRLAFARWITDRKAPTTARACVNRIWQSYFGIGLLETSEDFGTQAPAPSHPELLDWLAVEFMEHGWSQKYLHRLIVSSATYRQASKITSELHNRDPYNRLLARGPRFRVDAEVVRDIALTAGGLLNSKVGGRSVFPPLPDFLFQPPASYGPKVWPTEKDNERYRRALYTFRYRSVPHPVLQTFDAPNGDFACVRRSRSNTPLQALMTLNEPVFVECAQNLANQTLREGGKDVTERINYAFRRCLTRLPTEEEMNQLQRLVEKSSVAKSVAKADELATWTTLARVLLNLDETITKE